MTGIFGGDGPPAPTPPSAQPTPPLECWQRGEDEDNPCYAFHFGFETVMQYHGWPAVDKRRIKALKEKILADIGKILVKNEDYTMQFGTALQEAHDWTYYAKEVDEEDDMFPGGEDFDRVVKKLEENGYEVEHAVDSDGGWESYQSYMVYPKNLPDRTKSLLRSGWAESVTWGSLSPPPTNRESKSVKTKPIKQKPTKQKPAPPSLPLKNPPRQYQKPSVGLSSGLFDDNEKALEIDTFLTEKFKQHIPSWEFKWDNAAQRYGVYRYRGHRISVSLPRARVNTIERTKRTILHEIAHALTPGQKHNKVWKQKAQEIGLVNPTTCCTKEDAVCVDRMKWALRNRETREVYQYYTREPKDKIWSGRYIRGKKKETLGKLEIVKLGFMLQF